MILLLAILVAAFVTALRRPEAGPLPHRPVMVLAACAIVSVGFLGQRFI